jgi:hypothetical protein
MIYYNRKYYRMFNEDKYYKIIEKDKPKYAHKETKNKNDLTYLDNKFFSGKHQLSYVLVEDNESSPIEQIDLYKYFDYDDDDQYESSHNDHEIYIEEYRDHVEDIDSNSYDEEYSFDETITENINSEEDETNRNSNIDEQVHTHEYDVSVKAYGTEDDLHRHHLAGTTSESIYSSDGSHCHEIKNKTDNSNDHYHYINEVTGPSIPVGNGKHIHLVEGFTNVYKDHKHDYQFSTLVGDLISE